ncbi:hypothetical protein [Yersinia bercovieri]|uniref:hypothetical protein n=1 Tax=Yersinia bercovieri TaxID=634 RepID=UPI0011A5295A|nr:hypothetical protein [Yersinia bercovieri]
MNNNWPAYTGNNEIVNAIDIASTRQLVNGYGELTPTNSFPIVTVTDVFMRQWNPAVGGYIVQRSGAPLFYMGKAAFEAMYTQQGVGPAWAAISGKPTTFAPVIGTTATTAMAGNKTPTSTDRGGVLQQAAEASLAAQTVTDIATAQTAINNIVTKVNSITTKIKAGGLTA